MVIVSDVSARGSFFSLLQDKADLRFGKLRCLHGNLLLSPQGSQMENFGFKWFRLMGARQQLAMQALTALTWTGNTEHDDVQQHFNFLRELVQKVVIAPSADGASADLTNRGRLASILASMAAFQDYSAGIREEHKNGNARRVRAGGFRDVKKRLDFLDRFRGPW